MAEWAALIPRFRLGPRFRARRGPALSGGAVVFKPAKASHVRELLSSARESPMLGLRLQETDMVADSNSQIAWHRAQIRKHRETSGDCQIFLRRDCRLEDDRPDARDGSQAETEDQGFRTDHRVI